MMVMKSMRKSSTAMKTKTVCVAEKSKQREVDFELMAPDARKVVLTGDFNYWDEKGISMKKDKNGLWKTSMNLSAGRYEYKFIVDGQWWTDPANNNFSTNLFGSRNSVREVTS